MSLRTTIVASDVLMDRVTDYCKENGLTQTEFYKKAVIDYLENKGDFEIRDLVEEENDTE